MFAGLPPSSSDLAERKSVVPPSPPADRRREHRSVLIARSARCDVRWVAAVFVGSGGTEERCSAISSCRSAARTSLCFGCSLRSRRCSLGCHRLRRIWRKGRALFRHLLLQIGGANIENPPRFPTLAARPSLLTVSGVE